MRRFTSHVSESQFTHADISILDFIWKIIELDWSEDEKNCFYENQSKVVAYHVIQFVEFANFEKENRIEIL